MALSSEKDKNYLKLIKFQSRLMSVDRELNVKDVEKFLKDFDINYAMPMDNKVWRFDINFAGYTALHIVVQSQRAEQFLILKLILNLGADFTCKNKEGFTPLRLAFSLYELESKLSLAYQSNAIVFKDFIFISLLSAHIEFNNATNPRCNSGISHLHIACIANDHDTVKFFLEAGEDVNEAVKDVHWLNQFSLDFPQIEICCK